MIDRQEMTCLPNFDAPYKKFVSYRPCTTNHAIIVDGTPVRSTGVPGHTCEEVQVVMVKGGIPSGWDVLELRRHSNRPRRMLNVEILQPEHQIPGTNANGTQGRYAMLTTEMYSSTRRKTMSKISPPTLLTLKHRIGPWFLATPYHPKALSSR